MQFYQFRNYRISCLETQVSYCQAQLSTQTQPKLGAKICFIFNYASLPPILESMIKFIKTSKLVTIIYFDNFVVKFSSKVKPNPVGCLCENNCHLIRQPTQPGKYDLSNLK